MCKGSTWIKGGVNKGVVKGDCVKVHKGVKGYMSI